MSFSMFAGDTMRLNFAITNTAGDALDITGETVRWQASKFVFGKFSRTPILVKSQGFGLEVTDSSAGLLIVTLEPEDTLNLSGTFYQEVELVSTTGNVATVILEDPNFFIKKALIRPAL